MKGVLRTKLFLIACGFGVLLCVALARAESSVGWLANANPILTKATELPANQPPTLTNRDCVSIGYSKPLGGTSTDCFVRTWQGMIQAAGGSIIFPSSDIAYPLGTYASNSYLLPAPNQDRVLVTTPAPTVGTYLSIYDNLRPALVAHRAGNGIIDGYNIGQPPNRSVKDQTGKLMAFNSTGALTFSSNGRWLLADSPGLGFMRIDLETLQVTPFASSLQASTDYSTKYGQIAISDDGRFALIGSTQAGYLKVYDLATCSGTTSANYQQLLVCQNRDYWPYLSTQLPSFRSIYSTRFLNDDSIALAATYDWQSGASYKAATFRLTAPGKTDRGLQYLGLGDSYASGQGEFAYRSGTDTSANMCHLSPLSYPLAIGSQIFDSYQSVACSGARTTDITGAGFKDYNATWGGRQSTGMETATYDDQVFVNFLPGYRTQEEFVKRYQPAAVTLSVGGNDIGIMNILKACALPRVGAGSPATSCYDTYAERMQLVRAVITLFPKLQQTYRALQNADPGVRLYVVGYPQIATSGNCAANVWLDSDEVILSQRLLSFLNFTVKQAAASVGARYVDTEDAFGGHRLCETASKDVAVNGLTFGNDGGPFNLKILGGESYHPNVLGHELLEKRIMQLTNGLSMAMPAADGSIVAPTTYNTLAQLLLNNYVYQGVTTAQLVSDDDTMTESAPVRGSSQLVTVAGAASGLVPNTTYQVSIQDNTSTVVTNITSDADGNISGQYTVPASAPLGSQVLHLSGVTWGGQTIDVYQIIYVIAGPGDINGDGMPDSGCIGVPSSGQDVDSDGIDDACDPVIGSRPTPSISGSVWLTGNTIKVGPG